MTHTTDAFELVAEVVTEIAGGPELLDVDLLPTTRFHDDLALESVDLVTLAGDIHERTDGAVNLADRFAELALDDVVDLTLGRLADLVAEDLSQAGAS